ncbi:hypothetical protein OROGR_003775 [Orobanche gracilis]
MAQLEAIRYEIRSISFMNPGPLTTRLVDNIPSQPLATDVVDKESSKHPQESTLKVVESSETSTKTKEHILPNLPLYDVHNQAAAYARLTGTHSTAKSMDEVLNELKDESGLFVVLPISAESAELLLGKKDDLRGSDILLEAVLEEDVACNAKGFFSQAQEQMKQLNK